MKQKIVRILCLIIAIFSSQAMAWEHEISVGYGFGKEIEEDYNNHGFMISGKFYKFRPLDERLILTIDGTVSHWHASSEHHKDLTTVALAPNFRAYFGDPYYLPRMNCTSIRPYLGVSVGPTYLSSQIYGERKQGSHLALQSTLEVGTEWGKPNSSIDLNLHLAHYCNAGLAKPNQGINILYILSIGYQFG